MAYFCVICQDSIVIEKNSDDPNITILRCDHVYHTDCFFEWVMHSKNPRCLYCNRYPSKMTYFSFIFATAALFDVYRVIYVLGLVCNYYYCDTEVLSSIHQYIIIDSIPILLVLYFSFLEVINLRTRLASLFPLSFLQQSNFLSQDEVKLVDGLVTKYIEQFFACMILSVMQLRIWFPLFSSVTYLVCLVYTCAYSLYAINRSLNV